MAEVEEGEEREEGERRRVSWVCPECGMGSASWITAWRHRVRKDHPKPVLTDVDTGEIITDNRRRAPSKAEADYIALPPGSMQVEGRTGSVGPKVPIRVTVEGATLDGRVLVLYDAFRATNPALKDITLSEFLEGCVYTTATAFPKAFGLKDIIREVVHEHAE